MNDRDPIAVLNDRAHAASAALNRIADERPVPGFDADASRTESIAGGSTRHRWLAAAAAAVLVVGGVVTVAAVTDDRPTTDEPIVPTVPPSTPAPPPVPLVLDETVDGFEVNAAREVTSDADIDPSLVVPLEAYGPRGGRPGLGVTVFPGTDSFESDEPIDIGGRTGYVIEDDPSTPLAVALPMRRRTLLFYAASGTVLRDRDALVRVAEGFTVLDGEITLEADVLPDGWQHLGTEPNLLGLSGGAMLSSFGFGERGYLTLLEPSDATERLVMVVVVAGDESRRDAIAALFGATEVEIRNRPALAVRSLDGGTGGVETSMLTWVETPGTLVRVVGFGVETTQLTAIADALRPATDEEWVDVLERYPAPVDDPAVPDEVEAGDATVFAEGTFEDGTDWTLSTSLSDIDPALNLFVELDEPGSSGQSLHEGGAIPSFTQYTFVESGQRRFVAGPLERSYAERVILRGDGGAEIDAEIVQGKGGTAWIAETTQLGNHMTVVALDADGGELATLPLEFADDRGGPDEVDGTLVIDEDGEIPPIPTSYREAPASTVG